MTIIRWMAYFMMVVVAAAMRELYGWGGATLYCFGEICACIWIYYTFKEWKVK